MDLLSLSLTGWNIWQLHVCWLQQIEVDEQWVPEILDIVGHNNLNDLGQVKTLFSKINSNHHC